MLHFKVIGVLEELFQISSGMGIAKCEAEFSFLSGPVG